MQTIKWKNKVDFEPEELKMMEEIYQSRGRLPEQIYDTSLLQKLWLDDYVNRRFRKLSLAPKGVSIMLFGYVSEDTVDFINRYI